MDEKLLEVLGTAGYPTTMVGGLLLLFFYLRKAEAGMRTEINNSLARLQKDKADLQTQISELEDEAKAREKIFDGLREERRAAEDKAYKYKFEAEQLRMRVLEAERQLRDLQN